MKTSATFGLGLLCAAVLTACGGGGGGTAVQTPAAASLSTGTTTAATASPTARAASAPVSAAASASSYFSQIEQLYIAFYQRPADPAGLAYWAGVASAKGDLSSVISAFANSSEAQGLYGPINSSTIGSVIDAIYTAAFGHVADTAGKAWYVQNFNSGAYSAANILKYVLDGAQGSDLTALNNKTLVAQAFTQQIDGRALTDPAFGTGDAASFNVTFNGTANGGNSLARARAFLAKVGADVASIPGGAALIAYLQSQIALATDPIMSGQATITLTGVAATGSALAGATVTVTDKTGATVGVPTVTASDGSYSYLLPKGTQAPLVVSAKRDDVALVTPLASLNTPNANITPLTHLAATLLSPTGDASALAAQLASSQATLSADAVAAVVKKITTALAPLLTNVGDTTDPITGSFKANGAGHDRVLNALSISINSTGSGANISVSVKATVADGTQPPSIAFSNTAVPPVLPSSVASASLPGADTDALLGDLMSRFNTCYGLPLSKRIAGTGTAATMAAVECTSLFKGGSPANYLDSGSTVGPLGAYSTIFSSSGNGLVFDRAHLLAVSASGAMVISYRAMPSGSIQQRTVVKESGRLVLSGNQYLYSASVNPWAEDREFLNSPDSSYLNTGYVVTINNAVKNGASVFSRVAVTLPNGTTLKLVPKAGLDFLALVRQDGTSTNTSVLRMAGRFGASSTTGTPRKRETSIFWAANPAGADTDWTDAEIVAINTVGTWKLDFFTADNTGATPSFTQYVKTFTRPYALVELAQQKWAQLTPDTKALLTTQSTALGAVTLATGSPYDFSASGADAWAVPDGALAPLTIAISGQVSTANTTRWNDAVTVLATARKVTVNCATQTTADVHCASGGGYAAGTLMNQVQLSGTDSAGTSRMKSVNLYRVP